MKDRILFKRGNFRFKLTAKASKDITDIVSKTVWGSIGKTQWRMMNTPKFIPYINNPNWLSLYHGEKLLFTMVLSNRKVSSTNGFVNSYFIRYLTFNEKFRKDSNKKNDVTNKSGNLDRSLVRKCVNEVINSPENKNSKSKKSNQTIVYALVELNNVGSFELCKNFGLETIRNCRTIPFSRFFPKKDPAVSKLEEKDKSQIINLLHQYYKRYNLFFTNNIFRIGSYYVLKKDNDIIAGLQIIPNHWKVDYLPGISGAFILKILSKIPLLSRIVNPKEFRFAHFDGIYVKKGHEADLICLMESVLADFGLYTALICLDHQSTLCHWLRNSGKLGLLNKFKGDSLVQLVARFDNFSEEEIEQFINRPVYLSAFDMA